MRRSRSRTLASLAFVCTLLAAPPFIHASEQSQIHTFRGRRAFESAQYGEALKLFEQAVEADPDDVAAHYYRGVTRGRLGNPTGAIEDLSLVVERRPEHRQAVLELGIAHVSAQQYEAAMPWLVQARATPSMDATASFYLGLAHLRLGEHAAADASFARAAERAGENEDLRIAARFYQGRTEFERNDFAAADAHFAAVAAAEPTSERGAEAAKFRAAIQQERTAAYQLYGSFGFEYDTNVVLAPSDDSDKEALGISNQEDGRVTILAGGQYAPWRSGRAALWLGYEFFQSLHFDLSDYDIQDHRPTVQGVLDLDWATLGLLGRYDFYLRKDDGFLNQTTALPWIRVPESFGHTDLYYRMRRRDYVQRRFQLRRDGFNHALGLRQYVSLGEADRELWMGYRFDREDPDNAEGEEFGRNGHQLEAGASWSWRGGLFAEIAYRYRHERYDDEASARRRDDEHGLDLRLSKELTDNVSLSAGYFLTFNDSNTSVFEYDRQIVSLAVDVRFGR